MNALSRSVLLGGLLLTAACATRQVEFAPGERVYKLEASGLEIELKSVRVKKDRIEVELLLSNSSDKEIRFEQQSVTMSYQGRPYPVKARGWDRNVDVKPHGTKAKEWTIEIGAPPEAGVYDVTIGNVYHWEPETGRAFDPGKTQSLGNLVVKIPVPAEGS